MGINTGKMVILAVMAVAVVAIGVTILVMTGTPIESGASRLLGIFNIMGSV